MMRSRLRIIKDPAVEEKKSIVQPEKVKAKKEVEPAEATKKVSRGKESR
jgi:hypothetical protein